MYGFHRVIVPKGVVPQAAKIVDSTPKILHPSEMLLTVYKLNLDSTSMRQLRESSDDVPGRIREIVRTRGKMHNPITNSGGVMIGKVRELGDCWKSRGLKKGEWLIPLVSLSAIPMSLSSISEIRGDMVAAKGGGYYFR
ncbi:MAG: hypothetical protein HYV47_03240 [Candidatus Nealsonbacteria bacterium]|nr:hypothetical protein [Candidatus Nealsonbacteria bacterium]